MENRQFMHKKCGLVGLTRSIPFDIYAEALQSIDLKANFQQIGVGEPAG
jgi:hypothetical protein